MSSTRRVRTAGEEEIGRNISGGLAFISNKRRGSEVESGSQRNPGGLTMKRMLRALVFCGILATAAAAAQAEVFVGVRAPFRPAVVAAVPSCPGVGYIWAPGYYAGAVWVPGRWNYRGNGYGGPRYFREDRGVYYRHDFRYDRGRGSYGRR